MTEHATKRARFPKAFKVHLVIFLVVNLGLAVNTLVQEGDFSWTWLSLVWAFPLAVYGTGLYWLGKRESRDGFGPERLGDRVIRGGRPGGSGGVG